MRNLFAVVAVAVIALVLLGGLRWFDLISQDAMVIGFITGVVVAVMLTLRNSKSTTG
jgi:hypothetical protein